MSYAADKPHDVKNQDSDPGDRRRRWYHPRPEPRCRADLAGFNYSYWIFIILLVVILFFPW